MHGFGVTLVSFEKYRHEDSPGDQKLLDSVGKFVRISRSMFYFPI